VEMIHDDEGTREVVARDRNGVAVWRVVYERAMAAEAAQHIGRGHFVNVQGFDIAHSNGATHMRFERDGAGRDAKVHFFNGAGQATPNGEGAFGYQIERDSAGRIARVTNLDVQGKPMANRVGLVRYAMTWDGNGHVVRGENQDAEGKPVAINGVVATTVGYDNGGNLNRISLLGEDGKLARYHNDWVVQEFGYNQFGELTSRKYFKLDVDGKQTALGEWTAAYDDLGYPREIKITGAQSSRTLLLHDERGNKTEEKQVDEAGQAIVNDKGYAIKRISYNSGPEGMRWDETYYDAAGKATYSKAGYHRLTTQFGPTGALRQQTMEELDHSRFHYHRDVSEPEYDALGRLRRNVYRYENEKGELALDAGLSWAQEEENYDDNGRIFLIWRLGCPASAGAPAFSIDAEYHKTGALKRRVRQACDMNRKPLTVTTTGTATHTEEEFDQLDRKERIYETGFNEKTHGFSTREARFSEGTLQSVTHKRSDGSTVEAVGVFIVGVYAEQAKATELRPGDQLLEANGVPVRSGYEFAATFAGGWIEVLRDGKKLRIEGFEAGTLGIALEDRVVTDKP
jgi:hypothetical protein